MKRDRLRRQRFFIRFFFKHPKVEAITWWEFLDGQWLGAPSGFITQDNKMKPIYDEIYKLIKGEWWTGKLHKITDDSGSVLISGFAGDYEVTCKGKKSRFQLDNGNNDEEILLILK